MAFGIVIRGIECLTDGTTIFHNYGEGNGIAQTLGWASNMAVNNVWFWETESALEAVMPGRNFKVAGRDWTRDVPIPIMP